MVGVEIRNPSADLFNGFPMADTFNCAYKKAHNN